MKTISRLLTSISRFAVVSIGLGLVGAIGYLVIVQYHSQVALQQSVLKQAAYDSERRATALSYFFSERKDDLQEIAASRALYAYFENLALGMSMEYGLQASILVVTEHFDRLRQFKNLGEQPLYERIVFVDAAGSLLNDSRSPGQRWSVVRDWREFLSPNNSEPVILCDRKEGKLRIVVSTPCFFKGRYAGQVMGWISFPQIYHYFIEGKSETSRYPDAIIFGREYLHIPDMAKHLIPASNISVPAEIRPGRPYPFPIPDKSSAGKDAYVILVPVKNTSFSLMTFIPLTEQFDFRSPQRLLYTTGGLALFIFAGMLFLMRLNTHNALLSAHLEETTLREQAVDEKNRELAAEIRERQIVEDSLQKERDFVESLFETAQVIMLVLDNEGRIERFNPYLEEISGYLLEEVRGKDWFSVFLPEGKGEQLRTIFQATLHDSKAQSFVYPIVTKDSRMREIEWHEKTLWDADDRLVGLLPIGQDITERKRAEEEKAKLSSQLQQAQKMESVGRLAGGVAHDFNNMLSVILGHADLAIMKLDPAQPLHADLTEIRKAAERSADLTQQLLAFARKQTVAPKVLDLNETVAGMLKMLKRLIGEDIHLDWQPEANLWPVMVDPSQIDQILANLCVNARDAIADIGKITIKTGNSNLDKDYCAAHAGFVPGEYVLLSVSDDGCGMDKETLANIFEPFFTTKGIGVGTGLGLATVYGIVTQNNGFINVYSQPGLGTTFTIWLTRHIGKVAQKYTKSEAKPAQQGNETILLVEDEPAILTMTTIMLTMQGYTVLQANTPGEATSLAREHDGVIHLLVTDVVMPEMNGLDLAENLLSLYPKLKRLFMSGYTSDVIAHHGVLDEGVHFIPKPFTLQDLAAKVRGVLDIK